MRAAKLAPACVLAALALSACGTTAKPVAGSSGLGARHEGRGVVDDPRTKHLNCLRQHGLQVIEQGPTNLLIGTAAGGPTVTFAPTPGSAQEQQITAQVQGAEVIGSALLYPHQAPAAELQVVEDCLAVGVTG